MKRGEFKRIVAMVTGLSLICSSTVYGMGKTEQTNGQVSGNSLEATVMVQQEEGQAG